eukprot:GCRY01005907.1.p1 GENE.GCRY01005907.1~~GCRY01005907.1.p1  ORF type:complete len:582 (+),score=51.80 GCRY01005907.1:337-2082(+)
MASYLTSLKPIEGTGDCFHSFHLNALQTHAVVGRKDYHVVALDSNAHPSSYSFTIPGDWSSPTDFTCSPHISQNSLLAVIKQKCLQIFDFELSATLCNVPPQRKDYSDVSWSPFDPNALLSASGSNIYLFDSRTSSSTVKTIPTGIERVLKARFSPHFDFLIAAAHDGAISVWDTRSLHTPHSFIPTPTHTIRGLNWSPTDHYALLSFGPNAAVKFWDVNTAESTGTLLTDASVEAASYAPFERAVVTLSRPHGPRHALCLWDLESMSVITQLQNENLEGEVTDFRWRFSSLGRSSDYELISLTREGELRQWHVVPTVESFSAHPHPPPHPMSSELPLSQSPLHLPLHHLILSQTHLLPEGSMVLDSRSSQRVDSTILQFSMVISEWSLYVEIETQPVFEDGNHVTEAEDYSEFSGSSPRTRLGARRKVYAPARITMLSFATGGSPSVTSPSLTPILRLTNEKLRTASIRASEIDSALATLWALYHELTTVIAAGADVPLAVQHQDNAVSPQDGGLESSSHMGSEQARECAVLPPRRCGVSFGGNDQLIVFGLRVKYYEGTTSPSISTQCVLALAGRLVFD